MGSCKCCKSFGEQSLKLALHLMAKNMVAMWLVWVLIPLWRNEMIATFFTSLNKNIYLPPGLR